MSIFPLFGNRTPTAVASMPPVRWGEWDETRPAQRYELLKAYTAQNGLYVSAAAANYANVTWQQSMRGLRTVGFRVVEFHAAHLWPGTLPDALPIVTDNAALVPAIEQLWTWSNWAAQKQVAARWLAMFGDVFIKVTESPDRSRVYMALIDPAQVTDFDTDTRGYLTYIRIDVPQVERRGDKTVRVWHTEVWEPDRYRLWVHDKGADEELARLGTPREDKPLSVFGIDFVPFVHCMFRDVGEERGQAAIWPALEKIDEANLKATRLSQLLFRHNNVNWAIGGMGNDATGRPLPPPSINGAGASASDDPYSLTMQGERFFRLPGNSQLTALVPALNYDAALAILNADMMELEHDLPELAYARISEQAGANLSGRAIRFMLTPAIDRVLEARGNAESALIRAHQMALTIGANTGLFKNIGSYDAGDFAHSFADRDVIPCDEQEEAQSLLQRAQAAAQVADLLAPADRLRIIFPEWSAQDIEAAVAAQEAQTPPALALADRFAQSMISTQMVSGQ